MAPGVGQDLTLHGRSGGDGPPLLLLHGSSTYPHTTWHRVARKLVNVGFTVVCPDRPIARADARFATAWRHWFFFAQPDKPERAILADLGAWYQEGPGRPAADGRGEPRPLPPGDQ